MDCIPNSRWQPTETFSLVFFSVMIVREAGPAECPLESIDCLRLHQRKTWINYIFETISESLTQFLKTQITQLCLPSKYMRPIINNIFDNEIFWSFRSSISTGFPFQLIKHRCANQMLSHFNICTNFFNHKVTRTEPSLIHSSII